MEQVSVLELEKDDLVLVFQEIPARFRGEKEDPREKVVGAKLARVSGLTRDDHVYLWPMWLEEYYENKLQAEKGGNGAWWLPFKGCVATIYRLGRWNPETRQVESAHNVLIKDCESTR